ncbi:MAG TPA: ComEC/Rec2 family competence protein [Micromonosporaceae bacterium]|nr:ComEC/Rec2 family competence protein [Micromonosporaceae bacterium]
MSGSTGALGRLDLRLAGLAGAAWLAALAVLYAGAATGVVLSIAAAVLAAALGALVWRRAGAAGGTVATAAGWAAVGVLLGVVCGATSATARVAVRDAAETAELARDRTAGRAELVVRDDPRAVRGSAGRPAVSAIPADLRRLTWSSAGSTQVLAVDVRVLVLGSDPAWRAVLPGQRVAVAGRLAPARGGDLRAAVLSASATPELLAPPPWHQRVAGSLRAGLQRACAPLPDEPGGLLPGLVVGDTSRLDPAVNEDFRATGLTHLTAVSGANCAIVMGAVLLLARWCRSGPRLAAVTSLLALAGFVVLARPSPSVLRAAVMGALALVALASARPRAALPALAAAVAVLVVVDPELAGDAGFALSVLATGALLLLAPGWRDALRRRGVPPGLAEALAVPAAAQVACAPVIAGLSGTVSLVAVPANLLAVPAVAPATVLGVGAAVLSPVSSTAAGAVAWLGQWPAWWLVLVARHGAHTPAGALPWRSGTLGALLLAGVLVAALLAGRRRAVRVLVAVVAAAVVVGALPVRLLAGGWPPAGWLVVACAVGQGDAVVLPVAVGQAVVVDAGPDPAATDACLRRLGVTAVPLLVVSHFHADHVDGVGGVFRGRRVAAVVTPAWSEPEAGRALVRRSAAGRGVPVGEVSAGWAYEAGQVRLTVLGPPGRITGTRSDANNNSLVVRASVRGVDILLAGDAEGEEQARMLAAYGARPLAAQVLKVAHHGSAYQDPGFLAAAAPRVALVSVGVGNRYGHPNPAVLDLLRRHGARVLRTDLQGDLAAVLTQEGLAVVARGSGT